MGVELPCAFYVPEPGGGFASTAWTRGPWDVRFQHGGPPSALMCRAVDRAVGEDHEAWIPARTQIAIVRPVPIAVLDVRAEVVHRGRQTLSARAVLTCDEVEVAHLQATFVRRQEEMSSLGALGGGAPVGPDQVPDFTFDFFVDPVGYQAAMALRSSSPWPADRAVAWSRMDKALVLGETPSGWQRVACIADAAHGLAPTTDPRRTTLINPDLEIALMRRPVGVWIALEVRTATHQGVGLTRSRVYDTAGEVGASSATLVVRNR